MFGLNIVDENTPSNKKIKCPDCSGKGKVPSVYGGNYVKYTDCWKCHGKGEIVSIGICGICRRPADDCACTPVIP